MRQARIENAERTGVVVDLRDAELARLELLNEALDPLFAELPPGGRTVRPRHQPRRPAAAVDRRDRACRDGARQADLSLRAGRPLRPQGAEPRSSEVADIVDAVTNYVARRLIERERALADNSAPILRGPRVDAVLYRKQDRGRAIRMFILGMIIGCAGLFGTLMLLAARRTP